jgi:hypothetical protein
MNLAYSPPLLLRCLCVLTIDICLFLCFSIGFLERSQSRMEHA